MNKKIDSIVIDYKKHNLPLDRIAQKNNVSLHYVLKILHRGMINLPREIILCKEIIRELDE